MSRALVYLLVGAFCLLVQSAVLPLFLVPEWRPNLILILTLFLGIKEHPIQALLTVLLLGAAQDSLSGSTIGLHIAVYLVVFILCRLLAEKLNVDSPPLLILLIIGATLVHGLLIGFFMTTFADAGSILHLLVSALPRQMLSTLLTVMVFLLLFPRWLLDGGFSRSDLSRPRSRGDLT